MADFEYRDPDGDTLQVVSMNYPARNTPGWLFRAIPRDGSRYRSVWLPVAVGVALAEALGSSTPETPLQVAESASIRWRVGEHTIEIEGRTAGEVADALRVALGNDTGVLDELAEMLDCDPAELLAELRSVIERRDEAEAKADSWRQRAEDLGQRPPIERLQQAERAAKDADRLATRRAEELKALQAAVAADQNGITELRRQLLAVGLNGMSTAPLPEIAATIARLGQENNALREVNSRGSMTDDLQRQVREQQQEIEALRQIDDELQKAAQRERDLRKAAETGCEEWSKRWSAEAAAGRKLESDLAAKREQVSVLQDYLSTERRRVAELNGEVQRLTTNLADADRATAEAKRANTLLDVARLGLQTAAAELTAHSGPDDELDVRVLGILVEASEASEL
jgi:hypothetical protein